MKSAAKHLLQGCCVLSRRPAGRWGSQQWGTGEARARVRASPHFCEPTVLHAEKEMWKWQASHFIYIDNLSQLIITEKEATKTEELSRPDCPMSVFGGYYLVNSRERSKPTPLLAGGPGLHTEARASQRESERARRQGTKQQPPPFLRQALLSSFFCLDLSQRNPRSVK